MEKNSKRNTRANAAANKAPGKATEAPKVFEPPPLDPSTPSPVFGGGTGGLLRKAQIEEFYVITWDASKEQIFEMPTGGSAIMNKGGNLLKQVQKTRSSFLLFLSLVLMRANNTNMTQRLYIYIYIHEDEHSILTFCLALYVQPSLCVYVCPCRALQPRKEHCLALLTQLRTKFKIDGCVYRVFPDGVVEYLHPKVRSSSSSLLSLSICVCMCVADFHLTRGAARCVCVCM